jgi:hypothetical protein
MGWSSISALTEVVVFWPVIVVIVIPAFVDPEPCVSFVALLGDINKEFPNWTIPPLTVSIFTDNNSDIEEHPLLFINLLYADFMEIVQKRNL